MQTKKWVLKRKQTFLLCSTVRYNFSSSISWNRPLKCSPKNMRGHGVDVSDSSDLKSCAVTLKYRGASVCVCPGKAAPRCQFAGRWAKSPQTAGVSGQETLWQGAGNYTKFTKRDRNSLCWRHGASQQREKGREKLLPWGWDRQLGRSGGKRKTQSKLNTKYLEDRDVCKGGSV